MHLDFCPRCDERAYQHLDTHSFCIECNYSPALDGGEDEPAIPKWAIDVLRDLSEERAGVDEAVNELLSKAIPMNPEVCGAKTTA